MESLPSRLTVCPRCQAPFECRVDDIQNCECNTVLLDDKERSFISQKYDDCLCAKCMAAVKLEYQAATDSNNI